MLIIKVPDQFIIDITADYFALDSQLKSLGFRMIDQDDPNFVIYEDRKGKIKSNLRLYVFKDITPPLGVIIENYVVWFKLTETQYLQDVPSYLPDSSIFEYIDNGDGTWTTTFVRYKTWGELMNETNQGNDVANNGFHYICSNINGQVLTNLVVSQVQSDGYEIINNNQYKVDGGGFRLTETQYNGLVPSYFPNQIGKTWGQLNSEHYEKSELNENNQMQTFHYVSTTIDGIILNEQIAFKAVAEGFELVGYEKFNLERP
jgi:hypothetical protein